MTTKNYIHIASQVKTLRAVLMTVVLLVHVTAIAQVKVGGSVYGGGNEAYVGGSSTVVINVTSPSNGKNVSGDVYGGGAKAYVNSSDGTSVTSGAVTSVTLTKGSINKDVYGGGLGDADHAANVFGAVTVTVNGGSAQNVFGCNNVNGAPQGTVEVNISGGSVVKDVYGGGNLASTTASPEVNVSDGTVGQDVYGGGALANTGGTTVNITDGTVTRDVYGGGLGDADHAALVNGAVLVNIGAVSGSGSSATYSGNATIGGSVYGCNNANGSPQGDVSVNIYKTAQTTPQGATYITDDGTNGAPTYAISQVFGGGNKAAYAPSATTNKAQVHIYTCNNTVQTVYGGGNAADATDVQVIIDGGRFADVFGGGNGAGNHTNTSAIDYNPGANITGSATTQIHGGYYDQVFGGSNSKGDVASASLTLDNNSTCGDLVINNTFGGANEAEITGNVTTTLACSSETSIVRIGSFYGGSNQADIKGNVTLNVYGGTYDNVFGGSKGTSSIAANIIDNPSTTDITEGNVTLNLYGGTIENAFGGSDTNGNITGKITVNMLNKGGDCPLAINNIYGGGRNASYTPTTAGAYPEVNLIHGTVSKKADGTGGNVFGGGMGAGATVTSNPTIYLGYDATMATRLATLLSDISTVTNSTVSVAGNVYGGGDLAAVTGNTSITVQKHTAEGFTSGSTVSGDVYGGGNEAIVSGNTVVSITGGTVTDVYGGGALANVGTDGNNTTQVIVTGGTIRNVYGGGLGSTAVADDPNTTENEAKAAVAALVKGAVTVTIDGGNVTDVYGCNNTNGSPQSTVTVNINNDIAGNVYGGGNLAAYTPTTATTAYPAVNINNGTIGSNVYGGGKGATATVTSNPVVIIGDATDTHCAIVTGDVYGGGDAAAVTGNTTVTYNDNNTSSTVDNLFGGGNAAGVSGTSSVTLTLGKVTSGVYGGCNSSGSVGAVTIVLDGGTVGTDASQTADVYGGGLGSPTTTTGNIGITLGNTTVYGDIYGGSALGSVNAANANNTTTLTINGSNLHGTIYGGGKGSNEGEGTTATSNGNVLINYNTANAGLAGLYGGANINGSVVGNISVNIIANVGAAASGTEGQPGYVAENHIDIFGGGLGAATTTDGNVTVTIDKAAGEGAVAPVIYGAIYGGSALGSVNNALADLTTVNILSGTIHGNIYGGGLGESGTANVAKGQVNGTVIVNIGAAPVAPETDYTGNATIDGSVYGCNNTNGSPKGNVTVNVYKTAHTQANTVPDTPNGGWTADALETNSDSQKYAISAVYGGGNLASYVPVAVTSGDPYGTTVHVYNCDNTIQNIYGGGNAADVGTAGDNGISANTSVIIDGGRIHRVFGGGNGAGNGNPGASIYGTASTHLYAGLIDQVFGGSNERGNVRNTNLVLGDNNSSCDKYYGEVFGGGNLAEVNGSLITTIECGAGYLGDFYGGANAADIHGNVILNIYGGIYDNVFGGSKGDLASLATEDDPNHSDIAANIFGDVTLNLYGGTMDNAFGGSDVNGNITGKITVNMLDREVTGCGLAVHNIYGGGRNAAYTPTTPGAYPEVNLIHGTVSKKAVTSGNNTTYTGGNVFGGGLGSTATVSSSPKVTIGYDASMSTLVTSLLPTNTKLTKAQVSVAGDVYGGGEQAVVSGGTSVTVQQGTVENVTISTAVSGDVYGGGKLAAVTGAVAVALNGGSIANDVYGGGALAQTNTQYDADDNTKKNFTTSVSLAGATVTGNVYGGGLGRLASGDNEAIAANVNGPVSVAVSNGKATNVFGCNNINGSPQKTVSVNITGTAEPVSPALYTITSVFGGGNQAVYTGTPVVQMSGGNVENIFGGGLGTTATVNGNTSVTMSGGTAGYVFGGGSQAPVTGNSTVTLKGNATVNEDVFGGGDEADVDGSATVNIQEN